MDVPLALGCTCFLLGLVTLVRKIRFLKRAVTTTGLVVKLETAQEVLAVDPFHRMVIEKDAPDIWFRTSDGTQVVARLPPTHFGTYDLEQDLCIHYDPTHPQKVALPAWTYWHTPVVCFLVTIFFLVSWLLFLSKPG